MRALPPVLAFFALFALPVTSLRAVRIEAQEQEEHTSIGGYGEVHYTNPTGPDTPAQVNVAQAYLTSGDVPARQGNAHLQIVPYQLFATADGLEVGIALHRRFGPSASRLRWVNCRDCGDRSGRRA